MLHDIGKIGIPDAVLKKPWKFDDTDWAVMKTHSARGERIVLATTTSPEFWDMVSPGGLRVDGF
jgi:HD-GYP domain-containing protein (c-di-GMP phosphodiesterase class II)